MSRLQKTIDALYSQRHSATGHDCTRNCDEKNHWKAKAERYRKALVKIGNTIGCLIKKTGPETQVLDIVGQTLSDEGKAGG